MIIKKWIERIIFSSKWLLIPFYLKLFWTLTRLMYHFFADGHLSNSDLMATLEDVDIVMVANLVKMIITGSYNSFVDKSHGVEGEQVSSGLLKVKMATSIMGVSAIHLLQSFVDVEHISWDSLYKQLIIHSIFIVGAFALAIINYFHEIIELKENENNMTFNKIYVKEANAINIIKYVISLVPKEGYKTYYTDEPGLIIAKELESQGIGFKQLPTPLLKQIK